MRWSKQQKKRAIWGKNWHERVRMLSPWEHIQKVRPVFYNGHYGNNKMILILDFVDDLALPSHSQKQMQEKTSLIETVTTLRMNVKKGETKIMKSKNNSPITLQGEVIDEAQSFSRI